MATRAVDLPCCAKTHPFHYPSPKAEQFLAAPSEDGGTSRDREGLHGSVGAVASGDGEHCATFRSDEVMDGTSCGAKGPCG